MSKRKAVSEAQREPEPSATTDIEKRPRPREHEQTQEQKATAPMAKHFISFCGVSVHALSGAHREGVQGVTTESK